MANKKDRDRKKYKMAQARTWQEEDTSRKWEPTAIRLPDGVEEWKPEKEATYILDVVPYLADDRNPAKDVQDYLKESGEKSVGWYELTYYQHKNLGVRQMDGYVCARCFPERKSCPICRWMYGPGKGSEDAKKIFGQRRILMNVVDVTSNQSREKGIQVLHQAWGGPTQPAFGQMLRDQINVQEILDPFNPEDGYQLVLKVVKSTFNNNSFMKVVSVTLKKRKDELDEALLDQSICLSDCLIEMPDEVLERALDERLTGGDGGVPRDEDKEGKGGREESSRGGKEAPSRNGHGKKDKEEEPEEPEEKPSRGKKPPVADDLGIVKGSRVKHKRYGVCEVVRVSLDGTTLALEDGEGELIKGISPSDVTLVNKVAREEPEEEDTPRKGRPTSKLQREEPEDEEEEDDEPEEEEEEVTPKKRGRR